MAKVRTLRKEITKEGFEQLKKRGEVLQKSSEDNGSINRSVWPWIIRIWGEFFFETIAALESEGEWDDKLRRNKTIYRLRPAQLDDFRPVEKGK